MPSAPVQGVDSQSRPRSHRLARSRAVLISASRHNVTGLAAEAAFFGALALFPTVLTLVAVVRAVRPVLGADVTPQVSADLARLLRVVLTARGSVAADSADSLLNNPDGAVLGLGTGVSLLVLARGMRSVRRALAVIGGYTIRGPVRDWVRALLLSATLITVASVGLAAFTLGPLLGHSAALGGPSAARVVGAVWEWVRWPISLVVLLACALLLLGRPNGTRPDRRTAALPGALIAVGGWAAATGLLPLYVAVAGRFSPTLGALGGGLIVLVWMYLLNLSVLLGAEVNATRAARLPRRTDSTPGSPRTDLPATPAEHPQTKPGQ